MIDTNVLINAALVADSPPALTSGAELLVIGDRDLLELAAVAGVAIVTPAQACTLIEAWGRLLPWVRARPIHETPQRH